MTTTCPNCSSADVVAHPRGFSFGAFLLCVIGGLAASMIGFGPLALLAGVVVGLMAGSGGRHGVRMTCLACSYNWMAGSLIDRWHRKGVW